MAAQTARCRSGPCQALRVRAAGMLGPGKERGGQRHALRITEWMRRLEAGVLVEGQRRECNHARRHSALRHRPPAPRDMVPAGAGPASLRMPVALLRGLPMRDFDHRDSSPGLT